AGTNRRLRVFAITQIAASFVLVAGAGMLITTLFTLQRQKTGLSGNVLAVNVPVVSYERKPAEVALFYKEAIRRISQIAGAERVADERGPLVKRQRSRRRREGRHHQREHREADVPEFGRRRSPSHVDRSGDK